MSTINVAAIIVTFHPDIAALKKSLASLHAQLSQIIVIDNGSTPKILHWLEQQQTQKGIVLRALGANYGIAVAQNTGIECAIKAGYTHVLLMDQDSIAAPDMVEQLIQAFIALQQQNKKIAAVGPRYIDMKTNSVTPFIRYGNFKKHYITCQHVPQSYLKVDSLIASGTLLSIEAFDEIGRMEEAFFIDNVDIAWCLAAKAKQWQLYGVCTAVLNHNLGERIVPVWFFGRRLVPVHTPVRLYYIIRNSLLLCRKNYAGFNWYLQTIYIILTRFFIFGLLVSPRLTNLRMLWRGLWDGIRGKKGRLIQEKKQDDY